MATYFVRTKERTYNSITSPEHLKKVRELWSDKSPIVHVLKFVAGKDYGSWKEVPKRRFEEKLKRLV